MSMQFMVSYSNPDRLVVRTLSITAVTQIQSLIWTDYLLLITILEEEAHKDDNKNN